MTKAAPAFLENLDAFIASRERNESGAMARVATEVVKANFPHLMQGLTTKVEGDTVTPGASAEYFPLGNRIAFADNPLRAAAYPEVRGSSVNFTTSEVMNLAQLILHEAYHARSFGGTRSTVQDAAKAVPLTPEQKQKANSLATSFYSWNPTVFNSEEFMANADSVLNLKEIGGIVPGTRLESMAKNLETIFKEVPQVQKWVEGARRPEVPSIKSPAPSLLEQLKEMLK